MSICSLCSVYERPLLIWTSVCLLVYFIGMDMILYKTFMSVSLAEDKLQDGEMQTVFHPLSVKMIMNDHVTHYIATPISEGLCFYTNFAVNFYYITPNVISFTHLFLSFLSAKCVFSESLYRRRIGVILYEIRSFLDAFDGTVYRAHAKDKSYKSDHSNFGYWIDVVSDTIAGFLFCFAILFHFWWKIPPVKSQDNLPVHYESVTKWIPNGTHSNGEIVDTKPTRGYEESYSKRYIFWRVFCFGAFWGLCSSFWDQTVIHYHNVFSIKLDAQHSVLQTQYLHSPHTWWIFWFWRIIGGQAVIQMVCLAVFIDKTWVLFKYTQYTGMIAAVILFYFSNAHLTAAYYKNEPGSGKTSLKAFLKIEFQDQPVVKCSPMCIHAALFELLQVIKKVLENNVGS